MLVLSKTRIDLYKMSFSYSESSCWNALPSNLKNACSIDTFKYKILQNLHTVCDKRESGRLTKHVTIFARSS